uniref:G domain-containing protein n=1 Tax=Mycena chlorophos TaxID=658473 RepID=A0ABQ0MEB0_MYCCL|nr:predicted protein [Mycena chlorophos]
MAAAAGLVSSGEDVGHPCDSSLPRSSSDNSDTSQTFDDQRDAADTMGLGGKIRVLVTGRTLSGKTTLLTKICGSSHAAAADDLQAELVHQHYIFHDSLGFQNPRETSYVAVQRFLQTRGATRTLPQQVRAIWYCIRTDTHMFISPAEEDFFSANMAQKVPVIAVFTKYDALVTLAFAELRRSMGRLEAKEKRFDKAHELLQSRYILPLKSFPFPPSAFVVLKEDIRDDTLNTDTLLQTTLDLTSGPSLAPILRSVRQNNIDACLKHAVAAPIDATDVAGPLCRFSRAATDTLRQRPYEWNQQAAPPQNAAYCTTMFCEKIPSENPWTNARRSEAIAAACICIDQTFMEASACAADFPAAFQIALDAYFSTEHSPRSVVNKEIAKFSPQDYREVVDPSSSEQRLMRKAVPKLMEIIKAHRLRLRDE